MNSNKKVRGARKAASGSSPKKSVGRALEAIIAAVSHGDPADGSVILEQALEAADFWGCIGRRLRALKKSASALRIVIKPDLELYDVEASTGTDPRLVEHFIAMLHRKGYTTVSVVDGIGSSDLWLENRDPAVLADLAGYRYRTGDGGEYDIVNLSEDVVDGGFYPGSVLAGGKLGRAWREADFRIGVAKNKTHQEFGYSLGLHNLLGVLPLRDKEYHYHHRFDPGDVCVELLRATPLHFAVIDAVVSNHGNDGSCRVNPLATGTVIASENAVLCDFAGAVKMGLDPYVSPVNAAALRVIGLPKRYEIRGDQRPYDGWRNVPFILMDSVRRRNSSPAMRRMSRAWFQSVNRDVFPFRNDIDDKINGALTRLLRETDRHPLGLAGAAGLNYLAAWCQRAMRTYAIMYDKERVGRRETSLGFDMGKYADADFESIVDYMEPLARVVARTQPDRNGLRWRYLDHSVVFEFKRSLPASFDAFVAKVDIAAAVRMMNDNIGGACAVVSRDGKGRVTRQAERNIYLPQPNWMAMFGGDVIDVGKLELVRYGKKKREIFWRTVTSANRSARYDDGIVTFEAEGDRTTLMTIVARQEFVLPLLFQVFDIDYAPRIKDALVSDSYTTYFSRTMANYEALFEGRDVSTGKKWDPTAGEEDSEAPRTPVEQLVNGALKLAEMAQPLLRAVKERGNVASQGEVKAGRAMADMAGETVRMFFNDLFDAVKKDVSMTQTGEAGR